MTAGISRAMLPAMCLALSAASCAAPAASPASSDPPRFEDFPVAPAGAVEPVAPRLDSPRARRFRTMLSEQAAAGPNFAGHYTIAQWGCGSGCIDWAIVDARSGKVTFPGFSISGPLCPTDQARCGPALEFRPGSELVVVIGSRNERGLGRYVYRWHGGRLALLAQQRFRLPMQ